MTPYGNLKVANSESLHSQYCGVTIHFYYTLEFLSSGVLYEGWERIYMTLYILCAIRVCSSRPRAHFITEIFLCVCVCVCVDF